MTDVELQDKFDRKASAIAVTALCILMLLATYAAWIGMDRARERLNALEARIESLEKSTK